MLECILIPFKDLHSLNVEVCIWVTLLGIVIEVNELHPWNAEYPISVIEFGRLIVFKDEQFLNVYGSILVIELGIFILVKDVHPSKLP